MDNVYMKLIVIALPTICVFIIALGRETGKPHRVFVYENVTVTDPAVPVVP
jgi:hypothetical protein